MYMLPYEGGLFMVMIKVPECGQGNFRQGSKEYLLRKGFAEEDKKRSRITYKKTEK